MMETEPMAHHRDIYWLWTRIVIHTTHGSSYRYQFMNRLTPARSIPKWVIDAFETYSEYNIKK